MAIFFFHQWFTSGRSLYQLSRDVTSVAHLSFFCAGSLAPPLCSPKLLKQSYVSFKLGVSPGWPTVLSVFQSRSFSAYLMSALMITSMRARDTGTLRTAEARYEMGGAGKQEIRSEHCETKHRFIKEEAVVRLTPSSRPDEACRARKKWNELSKRAGRALTARLACMRPHRDNLVVVTFKCKPLYPRRA